MILIETLLKFKSNIRRISKLIIINFTFREYEDKYKELKSEYEKQKNDIRNENERRIKDKDKEIQNIRSELNEKLAQLESNKKENLALLNQIKNENEVSIKEINIKSFQKDDKIKSLESRYYDIYFYNVIFSILCSILVMFIFRDQLL